MPMDDEEITFDSRVKVTIGKDKGLKGKVEGVSPEGNFFDVRIDELNTVRQYAYFELQIWV